MALNKNNSAVKRIMQEARELANDPCTDYSAAPLEDDIFEWHCTLRGPSGTEFEGGLYHFRILLPAEYPFRPPSIMILTPNGRFELNTKICISFTSYHEELWQPAWGVRTAIIGLQGFFPLKGQAAVGVGSIEYPTSERKRLAALSREWVCPHCQQPNLHLLPDPLAPGHSTSPEEKAPATTQPDISKTPDALSTNTPVTDAADTGNAPTTPQNSDALFTISKVDLGANTSETSAQTTGESAHTISSTSSSTKSTDIDSSLRLSTPTSSIRPTPTIPLTTTPTTRVSSSRNQKPPMLLDGAICILLVLLFAIVCRRMV